MGMGLSAIWLACACADGDARQDDAAQGGVTWTLDIAPIVADHCVGCHQEGGIAPFAMQEYAQAKPWASAMADAVEHGRMPPFLAQETDECQPRLPWAHDLRLTLAQKSKLRFWANAGAPEGPLSSGSTEARQRAPGRLAREDVVMRMPEPIEVEGDHDTHACIVVDPSFDRDRYVTGRQITAGNARVLHHVISYVVLPGRNPDGSDRDKQQLEAAAVAAGGTVSASPLVTRENVSRIVSHGSGSASGNRISTARSLYAPGSPWYATFDVGPGADTAAD